MKTQDRIKELIAAIIAAGFTIENKPLIINETPYYIEFSITMSYGIHTFQEIMTFIDVLKKYNIDYNQSMIEDEKVITLILLRNGA